MALSSRFAVAAVGAVVGAALTAVAALALLGAHQVRADEQAAALALERDVAAGKLAAATAALTAALEKTPEPIDIPLEQAFEAVHSAGLDEVLPTDALADQYRGLRRVGASHELALSTVREAVAERDERARLKLKYDFEKAQGTTAFRETVDFVAFWESGNREPDAAAIEAARAAVLSAMERLKTTDPAHVLKLVRGYIDAAGDVKLKPSEALEIIFFAPREQRKFNTFFSRYLESRRKGDSHRAASTIAKSIQAGESP